MKTPISPEPALLGFLREGPLHGYDLHKRVMQELGPAWYLGMSQMYAILKAYEARGWLKTIVVAEQGRHPRKLLKLTARGERAFEAWLAQTARGLREFRVDFFVRLYFARAAGRPALRQFLKQQLKATTRERDALRNTARSSEFGEAIRTFRLAQLDAILDWLEQYNIEQR